MIIVVAGIALLAVASGLAWLDLRPRDTTDFVAYLLLCRRIGGEPALSIHRDASSGGSHSMKKHIRSFSERRDQRALREREEARRIANMSPHM